MFNENAPDIPPLSKEQISKYTELRNRLGQEAKNLLTSSAHFSELIGGRRQVVLEISGLQPEIFNKAEAELLSLGLMETGYAPGVPVREGLDVSDRRRLPSAVKQYVLQEIVKKKL